MELDRLVLPRKTLAHRRTLGNLTPEQSDRLVRVLRIIEEAEATFVDKSQGTCLAAAVVPVAGW